jgi:hypothetical protein
MNTRHDWSAIPSPAVLAAGVAFQKALFAAGDLSPRRAAGPSSVEHDDSGGSSFVLDLGRTDPVLILIDHDERDDAFPGPTVTAALGLDVLPGRYALEHETAHYTGAARWDGTRWAPALGVPGRIAVNVTDDKHLLAEAVDVLGELTEGEPDRAAAADLLAALRTGEWD